MYFPQQEEDNGNSTKTGVENSLAEGSVAACWQ